MTDVTELAKLSLLLEQKLDELGIIDGNRRVVVSLAADLQDRLDDLIATSAELEGLLSIGRAAQQGGKGLSPPVAGAALLMAESLYEALLSQEEAPAGITLH